MNSYKILIIDGNPFVRAGLKQDLTFEGYHVETADTPDMAIAKLSSSNFHMILADLTMDPMDGIGVIKEAKRMQPNIQAIAMSGCGEASGLPELNNDILDETFAKPCESHEINTKINYCRMKASLTKNTISLTLKNGKTQGKIQLVVETLKSLKETPKQNIDIITRDASKILGAASAFYNWVDANSQIMYTISAHNIPDDFKFMDSAPGHVCYDSVIRGHKQTVVITNLQDTIFRTSDPHVKRYGLLSYMGTQVAIKNSQPGTLCVADTRRLDFTTEDIAAIQILSQAISIEENRRLTHFPLPVMKPAVRIISG